MKDEDIVEKFSLEQWRTFDLHGHRVLKKYFKDGNPIDVMAGRCSQIDKRVEFPTTANFKEFIQESKILKDLDWIEEFPVIITNRKRWKEYNKGLGEDIESKGCMFFDFSIPKYNIIVELDGKSYHNELVDRARDTYCMWELGHPIIVRLESFGKYDEKRNRAEIKRLEKVVKERIKLEKSGINTEFQYSYREFLAKSWREEHKEEVEFIERLETKYSSKFNSPEPLIVVSCKKEMKSKLNKLFLNKVNNILKVLYKKEIAVNFR